jgi:hypothetical protein
MVPGGADVNTTLPLILSLVSTFCCFYGVVSFILGVIGIVFSIQAMNLQKIGDIEQARSKAKTATILAAVGMVLGVIGGILFWVLGIAASVMGN